MDKGLMAARRRFPFRGQAIEECAARDEQFRDLCTDFADAEAELVRWEQSRKSKRDERCAEYQELVDDLAREIAAALGLKPAYSLGSISNRVPTVEPRLPVGQAIKYASAICPLTQAPLLQQALRPHEGEGYLGATQNRNIQPEDHACMITGIRAA